MERDRYQVRYDTVEKRLLYSLYSSRRRAKKDNINHTITYDDLITTLKRQKGRCYYTGLEFSIERKWYLTPTVDRLDYRRGYTPDNVVIASCWANRSKFRLTVGEFQDLCWKVCENV